MLNGRFPEYTKSSPIIHPSSNWRIPASFQFPPLPLTAYTFLYRPSVSPRLLSATSIRLGSTAGMILARVTDK